MRNVINKAALVFFIWLLLDALNIPNMMASFLLAGEIPIIRTSIPPSTMMALYTLIALIVVFEILARNFASVKRIRQSFFSLITRPERPSGRRLGRI